MHFKLKESDHALTILASLQTGHKDSWLIESRVMYCVRIKRKYLVIFVIFVELFEIELTIKFLSAIRLSQRSHEFDDFLFIVAMRDNQAVAIFT